MNSSSYTNIIFGLMFLHLIAFSWANDSDNIVIMDDDLYDIFDFLRTPSIPATNPATPKIPEPTPKVGEVLNTTEGSPKTRNETATPAESAISPENMVDAGEESENSTKPTLAPIYRPARCELPMEQGTGPKIMYRYFYNKTSAACELFIYNGSDGNENRFFTKEQCMEECFQQQPKNIRALDANFDCTFDVMVLDRCKLTADFNQMTSCNTVPLFGSDRQQCLNAGCCYHHSFRICYQSVARNVRFESCRIFSRQGQLFYGVASFQSPANFRRGWMAYLTFTSPLSGAFCILKGNFPIPIDIGSRFIDDRGIILQSSEKRLRAGQRVQFLFAGTMNGERLDPNLCYGPQSMSSN